MVNRSLRHARIAGGDLPPSCPNRTRDEFLLDGEERHFEAHTGLLW